jgi:hypothetical protein
MKLTLIICVLILPIVSMAQIYNNPFLSIPSNSAQIHELDVQLNGTYNLSSNAITNKLFYNYLNSNFINDDAKSSVLGYLSDKNRYGGYEDYSIFCSKKMKTRDISYYFNLSTRKQYGALFTSDLYKLAFFGNKDFQGKTALLDGFKNNEQTYQSLQFGFFRCKTLNRDRNFMYGGGLSFVVGQSYNHFSMQNGTFYTSPSGDSIILDAHATSQIANQNNTFISFNGVGTSLNLFTALTFKNGNELRFQLSDFGFIYWFSHTAFNLNQKYIYTGEDVNAVNGNFNISNNNLFFDSIAKRYNGGFENGSLTKMLPFQLRLQYMERLSNTVNLLGTVEYINDEIQRPEVSLSAEKKFSKSFSLRAGVSVLGYGTYGITAGANVRINKSIRLILGSQHFEGALFIPQTHGQGFYVCIRWEK